MKLIIYIDGACRFNPGPMGIGVWISDDQGNTVAKISEAIGEGTNNVAEWTAYLRALGEAQHCRAKELVVLTDSKLLAEQLKGNYRIRNEKLIALWRQAQGLREHFADIEIQHIPREKNTVADGLAKGALRGPLR